MGSFSNGISGSMNGGFTAGNGFVTGFALTNGAGSALGGLGALQGTPRVKAAYLKRGLCFQSVQPGT